MKNLGIMTAVISPMLADGVTVNEKALTAILEDQIGKGAGSLLMREYRRPQGRAHEDPGARRQGHRPQSARHRGRCGVGRL